MFTEGMRELESWLQLGTAGLCNATEWKMTYSTPASPSVNCIYWQQREADKCSRHLGGIQEWLDMKPALDKLIV